MKEELSLKEKDMLVMKLLHYFITEEGYNPIILHGVQNEIWLENMEGPYRIVRIMTGYIHNKNQYDFDIFKTKKIMQKIKFKTFTLKMNALSIFVDLGECVDIENFGNINCVNVNNEADIDKSNVILDFFPNIKSKLNFSEKGVELFTKITNDINEKNKQDARQAEEVLSIKKPIVTYALIAINIIMFLMTYVFNAGNYLQTLLNFGALSTTHVVEYNQYYRLLTSAFLHIGVMHIFFNMYALNILGTQLESFYGHIKFLIIYLFCAIVSSLVSILFLDANTISVGASGAVFGLLGAMLYFGYHYRSHLGNVLTRQLIPIIMLNLVIGFMFVGINNAAHIGGLISGLIISNAIGIKYKTTNFEKINGMIVAALSVIFLIYMIFFR